MVINTSDKTQTVETKVNRFCERFFTGDEKVIIDFMEKKVKHKKVIIISVLILIVFTYNCTHHDQGFEKKKKVIRLSHCHQPDFSSELHTAAWIFQKWVNDNSETLEVKIYASNALGQEREIYEGMQLGGGANCALSGTAILNNFNQKIGVLDLPFIWRGYEHVHKVLDGEVGEMLASDLEKQGFKVLAWMDSWGYRNVVTSTREVRTPEQLRGLKIRTIETPIYLAALNAMGANATPMAFGEIYTSLQTGVLDGFEHNASVIAANKYYEVSKYIALTRHLFGPVAFIYSLIDWNELTGEEKETIRQAALMARDIERALAPLREAEAFTYLKEKGMSINEIDTTQFMENARHIQDEFARKRGAVELLDLIRLVR